MKGKALYTFLNGLDELEERMRTFVTGGRKLLWKYTAKLAYANQIILCEVCLHSRSSAVFPTTLEMSEYEVSCCQEEWSSSDRDNTSTS